MSNNENNENVEVVPTPTGALNNEPMPTQNPVEAHTPNPVEMSIPNSVEVPTQNQTVNMTNQAVNETQPNTAPIINTDAAKAKANELASKAKVGFGNYKEKLKTDKKVLGISIAIAVVLLLAICNVWLNGGSKGVVKSYAKAMVKYDAKKLSKLYHKEYIEYMEDLFDDDIEDIFEDRFESYEDKDYKILSYDIIDREKYDKRKTEDFAEDLEDSYDIDEDDVKEVYEYTIKFKIDDDGDKDSNRVEVYAVKIKGKWYIFN